MTCDVRERCEILAAIGLGGADTTTVSIFLRVAGGSHG